MGIVPVHIFDGTETGPSAGAGVWFRTKKIFFQGDILPKRGIGKAYICSDGKFVYQAVFNHIVPAGIAQRFAHVTVRRIDHIAGHTARPRTLKLAVCIVQHAAGQMPRSRKTQP